MSADRLREAARVLREARSGEFYQAVADLLDALSAHRECSGDEAGQGYTESGYGYVDPSCAVCGTPGEYAQPWPCAEIRYGLAVADAFLGGTQ